MNKDASLFLEALIRMDSKKIEEIYQKNLPSVKRFVLQNKGQISDAEDIFQKALLQITARYKREPFDINSNFEAYLFTVCKNLWRRELNKKKKWVTTDSFYKLEGEEHDIAMSIIEQKKWELFTEALQKLSDNCKAILGMFFAKIPYAKIVEKMNYSSETVARQRVFKCKNKLKDIIKKDSRFKSLK